MKKCGAADDQEAAERQKGHPCVFALVGQAGRLDAKAPAPLWVV